MTIVYAVGGTLAAVLFVYLLCAMLVPEKFG